MYELVGILMHAEHLEAAQGVGPHTISVPRICPADDIDTADFSNAVPDEIFEKIVAVIRIAVPLDVITGLMHRSYPFRTCPRNRTLSRRDHADLVCFCRRWTHGFLGGSA